MNSKDLINFGDNLPKINQVVELYEIADVTVQCNYRGKAYISSQAIECGNIPDFIAPCRSEKFLYSGINKSWHEFFCTICGDKVSFPEKEKIDFLWKPISI